MSDGNGSTTLLLRGPGGRSPEQLARIKARNTEIANALRAGERQCDIAKRFGVSKGTVNNINRFTIKGEPRWRGKGKRPPRLPPGEGAALLKEAEARLRLAQADTLEAEAEVLDAQALVKRQNALAMRLKTR